MKATCNQGPMDAFLCPSISGMPHNSHTLGRPFASLLYALFLMLVFHEVPLR